MNSFLNTHLSEVDKLRQLFDTTVKGIREEFDDHLESINDNTNEAQANYEYIAAVDDKLNRVVQRLEQLEAWMSRLTGIPLKEETELPQIELSDKEKKIFLVLYTASEKQPITYEDIALSLSENDFVIRGYITNMLEKGVPIRKHFADNKVQLSLDREFKEKQAKHNILCINQKTVQEFLQ